MVYSTRDLARESELIRLFKVNFSALKKLANNICTSNGTNQTNVDGYGLGFHMDGY